MRWLLLCLGVTVGGCRCSDPVLARLTDQLHAPMGVDCGRVRVGASVTVKAQLDNVGRTSVDGLVWAVLGQGFALGHTPTQLDPGPSDVEVVCTPVAPGAFDGTLTLNARGETLVIGLSGEGFTTPECPAAPTCQVSTWSDALGACVQTPAADGSACATDDACLAGGACHAGRCTGLPRDCDDHDACTDDACSPGSGCLHVPIACPGDGVCQVGVCDPSRGCGLKPAEDGQPCGPLRTCVAAQVCIAGTCEVRHPPNDFVCAEESPCQPQGRCRADVCVQGAPTTLRASWAVGEPQPDGGPPEAWSDLLAWPDGGLAASSYFISAPTVGFNTAAPVTLPSAARRCIAWGGSLACADHPSNISAAVSAVDLATGLPRWTYTRVATDLPFFAGPSVQVFLARLALVDEHQLAAVFESRTPDAMGVDTRCRRFGVVVLDDSGRTVASTMIDHPIFDICTHPHSYGVAVDTGGNLYFAFSPSDADNPATAIGGTTLFSYSPTLALRWLVVEPMLVGGELAVARGHLFHERSTTVWATATGAPVGQLPVPFGFGVVSRDLVLPAPLPGSTDVLAVDAQTLAVRWSQPLGSLAGGPVHLGAMTTSFGTRTVALAFAGDASNRRLAATDVATGASFFSCPIDLPERPVQSALTVGQLAVMSGPRPLSDGTPECDHCDPRWARTRNTFRTFTLPGLVPVDAPWPGAWGGIGHDHREDRGP